VPKTRKFTQLFDIFGKYAIKLLLINALDTKFTSKGCGRRIRGEIFPSYPAPRLLPEQY
jgi:hypothetical protein